MILQMVMMSQPTFPLRANLPWAELNSAESRLKSQKLAKLGGNFCPKSSKDLFYLFFWSSTFLRQKFCEKHGKITDFYAQMRVKIFFFWSSTFLSQNFDENAVTSSFCVKSEVETFFFALPLFKPVRGNFDALRGGLRNTARPRTRAA